MKKVKRILALAGAMLLFALYASTLIFAFIDSDVSLTFLRASIACTIILPVLIYAYILVYRVTRRDTDINSEDQDDQNSPKYIHIFGSLFSLFFCSNTPAAILAAGNLSFPCYCSPLQYLLQHLLISLFIPTLLLYGAMSAFMTAFVPYIFVSATFMNSPPDDFSSDICNINRKMCTTCGRNLKKTL